MEKKARTENRLPNNWIIDISFGIDFKLKGHFKTENIRMCENCEAKSRE